MKEKKVVKSTSMMIRNWLRSIVMSIPTLKLVDAKEVKGTNVGAMSKAELESWLLGHGVQL